MGTIMVAVDRIQFPKHYIREHKNQEIIKTWIADVKEKKSWYFPPVEVWVPKEGLEKGKTHELIDGYKRLSTAIGAGVKQIPVKPLAFKEPVDAFARQYQANADNGEFLTPAQRNHYIQIMRTIFKLNLAAIAKITKLSKAQVSRIARGIKQTSRATSPKPGGVFSAKSFLDGLVGTCEDFSEHEKAVQKFCVEKHGKPFTEKIVEALQSLYDTLTEALKAAEQEAEAGRGA